MAAVSWRVQLAVLKDAKLDVTALSEPIERLMHEPPPGLLANGKLNVVEEDEPVPAERETRAVWPSVRARRRASSPWRNAINAVR